MFAIHAVFFLSGVGALVFENVWFNQLGLIVGNSVWSAALVIGAFMAGLALGNGLAVVLARRWGNLVRGYGLLEAAAALSGALLVFVFPSLPTIVRPLLALFLDDAALLNAIRIVMAFGLMVIPATALGATLPLLSKPLEAASGNYGWALGRLYGINTLGAVGGTLLAEMVLIPGLGLRHSGLVAAACNLSAAFIALRLARQPMFDGARSTESVTLALFASEGKRIVLAAFLAGGMLASRWSRHGWSARRAARFAAAGGAIMDAARSRERLEASAWIAAALPSAFIARSGERIGQRAMLDAVLNPEFRPENSSLWADLGRLIRDTDLVTLPLWLLESEARKVEIAGTLPLFLLLVADRVRGGLARPANAIPSPFPPTVRRAP